MTTPLNARTVIGDDIPDDEEEAPTVVVTDLSELGIIPGTISAPAPTTTPFVPDPTRTSVHVNVETPDAPEPSVSQQELASSMPDLRRIQRSMPPQRQDDSSSTYGTILATGLVMLLVGGGAFTLTAWLVWG